MGTIEVICGPMFSGKTEELIRRLRRAAIAKRKVQVFKPRIDNRYDEDAIVSHSQQKIVSTVIDKPRDILEKLEPDVEVIGVDEVHFLTPEIVPIAKDLAGRGLRVIIAGLDQDYRGVPFEHVTQLLAEAEYVTKELAICVVCGQPAGRSQRIVASEDRIHVGAQGAYEPRCRDHFSPEPQPGTTPMQQELLPFLRNGG
jgi:thymidine kinase